MKRVLSFGFSILLALGIVHCGDDSNSGGWGQRSNGEGGGQSGSNSGGSSFTTSGAGGEGGARHCVADPYEATVQIKPVDIIVSIDNSGSMGGEIEEVEKQINANFAMILDNAVPAIDYRVIMVSKFGKYNNGQDVCISEPLGGKADANKDGHCDDPSGQPIETAKFFHHSLSVGSHNALCQLLAGYGSTDEHGLHPNGYKDLLRPEALKFFLVITDDGVNCSTKVNGKDYSFNDGNNVSSGQQVGTAWDAAIRELDPMQFGVDEANRNYTFWSIISQAGYMKANNDDYGEPIPASETITSSECQGNGSGGTPVDPGTGYQSLSILSEGYRYPTCALDYTKLFTLMAQGVIDGAVAPCEFEMPDPPEGETLDPSTIQVVYTAGDGSEPVTFAQVSSAAQCNPNSFYVEDEVIKLCEETCSTVQADDKAKVDLLVGCGTPLL